MNPLFRLIVVAFLSTIWLCHVSRADTPIVPDSEAWKYVGQNVTVEVVTAVSTSKKGNTFINFGGLYPNQTFTGWIPAGTDLEWDTTLESLRGKKVKITGTIQLYQGKPEIKLLSSNQITEELALRRSAAAGRAAATAHVCTLDRDCFCQLIMRKNRPTKG